MVKKCIIYLLIIMGILSVSFWGIRALLAPTAENKATIIKKAERLVRAYPEAKLVLLDAQDGLYVVSGDVQLLFSLWTECTAAYPNDMQDAPLCAMFTQEYPKGAGARHPEQGFDPGRVRNEEFFKLLYGNNAEEVEKQLVYIDFMGEIWGFSSRNGVAAAILRIMDKLEQAIQIDPNLKGYIQPVGGGYFWRKIKDSPRLSVHSFGACLDLNPENGIYWLWYPSPEKIIATKRDYPQIIIDIFEAEGFIWGGKWHSFDYMHFEYRPELLIND